MIKASKKCISEGGWRDHAKRMEPQTLLADQKKFWIFPGQNQLQVNIRVSTVLVGKNYYIFAYSSSKPSSSYFQTNLFSWHLQPFFNYLMNLSMSIPTSSPSRPSKGQFSLKNGMNYARTGQNQQRAYLTRLYFINHSQFALYFSFLFSLSVLIPFPFDLASSSMHNFCRQCLYGLINLSKRQFQYLPPAFAWVILPNASSMSLITLLYLTSFTILCAFNSHFIKIYTFLSQVCERFRKYMYRLRYCSRYSEPVDGPQTHSASSGVSK